MKKILGHWKLKALAHKLIWALPGGSALNSGISRLRSGHAPEIELLQKHAPNFFRQLAVLRRLGVRIGGDSTFLEIGTGWDLDVPFLSRLCGYGTAYTVDVVRHLNYEQVRASVALMPRLLEELEQHSPYSRDELARRLAEAANVRPEDFCDWARIQYIAPITSDYQQIPDYSCDVVYSTAVFEHIYRSDLASTLHQIRRILRPTGFTTHVIDLKDHFCYSQSGLPYNNFLRFSDSQWQRWTGNPLTYTNRMFVSDWEKLFADCGFRVVFLDEVIERRLPRLPSHLLHDQWRDCSERDLSVGEIHIVARPAA